MALPVPSPEWIAAIGAVGAWAQAAATAWTNKRDEWVLDLVGTVEQLSKLDPTEVSRRIDENPIVAQVIIEAIDASSRAAAADKRAVLAQVVLAALDGTDDATLDELPFFLRAIVDLEYAHIRILRLLATPMAGIGATAGTVLEGASRQQDLVERWPGAADMIVPLVHALEAEGLAEDVGAGTYGGVPTWRPSGFGRRLLGFLPEDSEVPAWLEVAEVTVILEDATTLVVRNLGPGAAFDIDITGPERTGGSQLIREPVAPVPKLGMGGELRGELYPPQGDDVPPYRFELRWRDCTGDRRAERHVSPAR